MGGSFWTRILRQHISCWSRTTAAGRQQAKDQLPSCTALPYLGTITCKQTCALAVSLEAAWAVDAAHGVVR